MTRGTDWLRVAILTLIGLAACVLPNLACYLLQRLYAALWPWVSAHAEAIVAVVLTVGVVVLFVLAMAEKAKRNNPSW